METLQKQVLSTVGNSVFVFFSWVDMVRKDKLFRYVQTMSEHSYEACFYTS